MTAMMNPSGGYLDPGSKLGSISEREDQVIAIIVNQIVNDLNINSGDISRTICEELLKTNLRKLLVGRHNALDNYYNDKLEELLPEIYLNFDLEPKEIEIDRNHSPHAKLYTIMKAIKKKYDISDPKRKRALQIHELGNRDPMDSQCETMSAG